MEFSLRVYQVKKEYNIKAKGRTTHKGGEEEQGQHIRRKKEGQHRHKKKIFFKIKLLCFLQVYQLVEMTP